MGSAKALGQDPAGCVGCFGGLHGRSRVSEGERGKEEPVLQGLGGLRGRPGFSPPVRLEPQRAVGQGGSIWPRAHSPLPAAVGRTACRQKGPELGDQGRGLRAGPNER